MSRSFVHGLVLASLLIIAPIAGAQQLYSNIIYESPGSTRNMLDVIIPAAGARGTPTILYIHGGAWHTRDKTDDMPVYLRLAQRGYAVVACNYTLAAAGSPSFPQPIQDVKNALRWIRTDGRSYGLSPRIVVVGPSAGAHLAMMAAMTSGNPQFETLEPPLGGYRPDAFISIAGFSDLEWHVQMYGQQSIFTRFLGVAYDANSAPLYRNASPIFHLTPCDPPGAFIHGTADVVAPHQHAIMMADAMRAQRIFVELSLMQGAGHSFDPFGGPIGIADRIAAKVEILMPYTRTPDLNGDGLLTAADFDEFLQLFNANDPRADINRDGRLDADDFTAFFSLFDRGC